VLLSVCVEGLDVRTVGVSFPAAGWAWENSGEITRVDLRAFRVESRAPTQRLQLL
jgi:hypothetical protein